MPIRSHRRRFIALAVATTLLTACGTPGIIPPVPDRLQAGTWGGQQAGVIVNDSVVHVHIGCTFGNIPAPVTLDAEGRFDAAGSYVLRAYPVLVGPPLPARFSGQVTAGGRLTLSVVVTDTVQKRTVTVGPATVHHGREPIMPVCPICRQPGA